MKPEINSFTKTVEGQQREIAQMKALLHATDSSNTQSAA